MRRVTSFTIVAASVAGLIAIASSVANCQDSSSGCGGVGLFGETFDGAKPPALPPGWAATNAIDPDGIFWVASNLGDPSPPADSLPNAAFINDPGAISDKRLDSPLIFESQGTGCAMVTFRNNFSLEDGLDGGVLEVSYDSGATFQDVLAAGGNFTTGGYNGTISNCCGNPLAGRQAWTGDSDGFITTTVEVPLNVQPYLALRWRMGTDVSGSGQGWRIDTILVEQPNKPPPPSVTPTATLTPTVTPTAIPTATPTPPITPTATPSPTPTPNATPPPTPTPRPIPSPRPRPTPHSRPAPF